MDQLKDQLGAVQIIEGMGKAGVSRMGPLWTQTYGIALTKRGAHLEAFMINKQDTDQRKGKPKPNLGQKEAELEKARKESLGHMEDEEAARRRKKETDEPKSPKL